MLREAATEVVVPEPVLLEIQAHGDDDPAVKAIHELEWLRMELRQCWIPPLIPGILGLVNPQC